MLVRERGRRRKVLAYPRSPTTTNMSAAPVQVSAIRPTVMDERYAECASGSMSEAPMYKRNPAAKRYLDLTAEEVRAAFAKWVRPEDLARVSVGPTPH
jgi:hypothetical protein